MIDNYGSIVLTEKEIFNELYSGKLDNLSTIYTTNDIAQKFNNSKKLNRDFFDNLKEYIEPVIDLTTFDKTNQQIWFMPENYCPTLIEDLYNLCKTEEEKNRVTQELELFVQHNMLDVLFYLKYLVDIMRQNNILWGVGRGSSVASYVLYLIGIHKINPIKYDIPITEFLK